MTRRERLENKLARREEWADKAHARSEAAHAKVDSIASNIPLGQPILVGHHSEAHARRDAERIRSGMDKAVNEGKLAAHHESKAAGLASQLDNSIFSDDDNAIEALQARIAEREREAEHMKAVNAAWKKATAAKDPNATKADRLTDLVNRGIITAAEALDRSKFFALCHWEDKPFPTYATTNLRANIRRDRERIEEIQRRAKVAAEAAAAPGGVRIAGAADYVSITFAEKPDRSVLDALKAAGFVWSGGSWCGYRAKIPAEVTALTVVG